MKKLVLLLLFLVKPALADETAEYLQDISVTIGAGYSQGSGVLFRRGDRVFVWTAAHVVDGLRTTTRVTDPKTGTSRTVIKFKDAMVIKHLIEDGRTIGKTEWNSRVLRYSEKQDLAILQVRSKNFVGNQSVKFYNDSKPPSVGSELWHCGSLLGEMGSNSITTGVVSQHGRLIDQVVYDQTTVTAFPGSSGGGVYLKNGEYVGMLVRGAGEGFNLIVPVRRLVSWAKKVDAMWAIDPEIEFPDDYDQHPVEHIDQSWSPTNKNFPFLISVRNEKEI
jgi:S1-C subfamily serine protease